VLFELVKEHKNEGRMHNRGGSGLGGSSYSNSSSDRDKQRDLPQHFSSNNNNTTSSNGNNLNASRVLLIFTSTLSLVLFALVLFLLSNEGGSGGSSSGGSKIIAPIVPAAAAAASVPLVDATLSEKNSLCTAKVLEASTKARNDEIKSCNGKIDKRVLKATADVEALHMSKAGNSDEEREAMKAKNTAIKHLTSKHATLEYAVQVQSRQLVLAKFGEGPHYLDVSVELPASANSLTGHISIELAPLDLMPHSIYVFLTQTDEKLWDGMAFIRNARHVLQASPRGPNRFARKRMQELGVSGPAFQEYSHDYPHEKYTIGFAGRPGGPDWYISTQNNVKNHGPGGQANYDVKNEADPCFGKVIDGFDIIAAMHALPVKPGDYNALEEYVIIKSIRIVSKP
jgi:hypothetical protein